MWIAPARLHEETRHILHRLHLDPYVDFFRGEHLGFAPTAEAVARWWDLPVIAAQHQAFLDRHARVLHAWEQRPDTPPEDAYRDYLLALDSWRHLPYVDPGLPATLLPGTGPASARPRCSGRCTSGCGTRERSSQACEGANSARPQADLILTRMTPSGPVSDEPRGRSLAQPK